jgi:hypothetical protein
VLRVREAQPSLKMTEFELLSLRGILYIYRFRRFLNWSSL